MARTLIGVLGPYLRIARNSDWATESQPRRVTAAEVTGFIVQPDSTIGQRKIYFKADRSDFEKGDLRLTDYKTGKPLTNSKTPEGRRKHLLQHLRSGQFLQAAGYAAAEIPESDQLGAPTASTGRYLLLSPDETGEQLERELLISHVDKEALEIFSGSLNTLLDCWNTGTFFPRLVDVTTGNEPQRCQYCGVSQACLRGDSGARLRFEEWVSNRSQLQSQSPAEPDWVAATIQAWSLEAKTGDERATKPKPKGQQSGEKA
jgi:hypothetical protein